MDFIQENDNEIIRNILEPELFIPDSFETIYLGMSVVLIAGKLKDESIVQLELNPGKKHVQGVRFGKPTWNLSAALEWLKENQKNFKADLEATKKCFGKTGKDIKGVDIFAAGKWNGDEFTEKDLDAMVANFEKTKKHIPPFLKLGHDNEQALLKAEGLPSAGWVEKIYRVGNKLKADFRDVPAKIYDLIEKGAYRKVSIELFQGLEILEQKFNYLIGAVALLGAETPGVMVLDDILARYGLKDYDKRIKSFTDGAESVKIYEYENETQKGGGVPDKDLIDAKATIKDLEAKLEAASKDLAKFKKNDEKANKELEQAKKDLEQLQKDFAQSAQKLKETEIEKQVAELEAAELCTPAMKPFMLQLLDADKKDFSIKKDDEEKALTRFELIKETLELAKESDVNFDNNSADTKGKSKDFSEESVKKEIEKYQEENKVNFSVAYKAVMKKYEQESGYQELEDEQ